VENTTAAIVISVEVARVDSAILRDYVTSNVAQEEPQIGSTEPNFQIDNNCTDDKVCVGMPEVSGNYENEQDVFAVCDDMPTATQRRWPATNLERFDQGTGDVKGHDGNDRDDVDAVADVDDEASQADDESTLNGEDCPGNEWC
jgi:hypothetical protein